jgi:hypothetical protein
MIKLRRLFRKIVYAPSSWVGLFLGVLLLMSNHPSLRSSLEGSAMGEDRPSLQGMNEEKSLLREGTNLSEARGKFKIGKDRIVFSDEGQNKSFACLENLMLQRIDSFLKDDEGGKQRWTVSGRITEFNGENFLWIDRAIRAQ